MKLNNFGDTMKIANLFLITTLLTLFTACGGAGGTETGTTDPSNVDTTTAAAHIQNAASALVLSIDSADLSANMSPALNRYLIDGTSAEWDTYTSPTNGVYLSDIFGSETEEPRVVTKVRVLLDSFHSTVESILANDPDLSCTGSTALTGATSTIDIAFYGSIANGTSADPFFDCLFTESDATLLYGSDADGNLHLVEMSNSTSTNTEQPETRGDEVSLYQVISGIFGEATESGVTAAYLDLQYTQATIYNGVDGSYGTDDDNEFKSRSRITGRVILDTAGEPTDSAGDFSIVKYDRSPNPEGTPVETITQSMGRGNFLAGGNSIFRINSNVDALVGLDGEFCLLVPTDGSLPDTDTDTNCTSLETGFAWGSVTFPFDLTPAISATLTDNDFFAGDESELIDDDGSDFTIPTY